MGTRGVFTCMLCLYFVYHVYHPSPYRHAIVGFFKRAIACIRLPSSHAATLAYPRLASVASIIASSHSLAPRRLMSPSSSSTVPRVVLLLSSKSCPSLITTPNVVTSIPSTLVTTLCSSLVLLACFRRRPATTSASRITTWPFNIALPTLTSPSVHCISDATSLAAPPARSLCLLPVDPPPPPTGRLAPPSADPSLLCVSPPSLDSGGGGGGGGSGSDGDDDDLYVDGNAEGQPTLDGDDGGETVERTVARKLRFRPGAFPGADPFAAVNRKGAQATSTASR